MWHHETSLSAINAVFSTPPYPCHGVIPLAGATFYKNSRSLLSGKDTIRSLHNKAIILDLKQMGQDTFLLVLPILCLLFS